MAFDKDLRRLLQAVRDERRFVAAYASETRPALGDAILPKDAAPSAPQDTAFSSPKKTARAKHPAAAERVCFFNRETMERIAGRPQGRPEGLFGSC